MHETGNPAAHSLFKDHAELLSSIDALPYGERPWFSIELRYVGPITPDMPEWKLQTYTIYTRNPVHVVEQISGSSDFRHTWDYAPYEEYTAPNCRRFSNLMSGRWAFKKAASCYSYSLYSCLWVLELSGDETRHKLIDVSNTSSKSMSTLQIALPCPRCLLCDIS